MQITYDCFKKGNFQKNEKKTIKQKTTKISTYLLKIKWAILQSKDNLKKKKQHLCGLQETDFRCKAIQTKSEKMEKDNLFKWQESCWYSYTHIRQTLKQRL